MPEAYFHGIEYVEIDTGVRPIETVRSSVIGIIGTAPDADADQWPADTPVLITSIRQATNLGLTGTLPGAISTIHEILQPWIVVIRVEEGLDDAATLANVIGAVADGVRTGAQAFLDAQTTVQVTPKLLIAPGFGDEQTAVNALLTVATRVKAVVIADGPNTDDADAATYAALFDDPRLYLVDPWITNNAGILTPASSVVAAMTAYSDQTRGWWYSPGNQVVPNIQGLGRPIEWAYNEADTQANYLNGLGIATFIHEDGFRLWGDRSVSADTRWVFLAVRRIADQVNESLVRAHLPFVSHPMTRSYFESVVGSVNAYLRRLKQRGGIIGGKCWADAELNTPDAIASGRAYFNFDFSPPYPAERLTFQSAMVNDYLEEIF